MLSSSGCSYQIHGEAARRDFDDARIRGPIPDIRCECTRLKREMRPVYWTLRCRVGSVIVLRGSSSPLTNFQLTRIAGIGRNVRTHIHTYRTSRSLYPALQVQLADSTSRDKSCQYVKAAGKNVRWLLAATNGTDGWSGGYMARSAQSDVSPFADVNGRRASATYSCPESPDPTSTCLPLSLNNYS